MVVVVSIFQMAGTIFLRVSGGDLFAESTSILVTVPFDVLGTVTLEATDLP